MLPSLHSHDAANGVFVNSVLDAEFFLCRVTGCVLVPNRPNFFYRKQRFPMIFAAIIGAVRETVRLVFFTRSPLQVFKAIVGRVAIWEVATFHAVRTWPDKGFKNEPMNSPVLATRQHHAQMPFGEFPWPQ